MVPWPWCARRCDMIGVYQRPGKKVRVSRLREEAARIKAGLPPEDLVLVLPLEPDAAAAPAEPPVAVGRAKPGPKPKHGIAMGAAERQRARRAREQEPEKRNLVAAILRIYKHGMTSPDVRSRTRQGVEDIRGQNRALLRSYHDSLTLLTVRDLRKALDALESVLDSKGRLPNERSGEGPHKDGVSEMERIIAAKQRDELIGGRKGAPAGAGPQSYDAPDTTVDPADSARKWIPGSKPAAVAAVDDEIESIIEELFEDTESPTCLWCSEKFLVPTAAENHLYAEYNKAKSQRERIKHLEACVEDTPEAQFLLDEARQRFKDNGHFAGINKRIRDMRRSRTETKRKAKAELAQHTEQVAKDRKQQDNPVPKGGVPTILMQPADIHAALLADARWDTRVW
jgi:hypothetical protein